MNDEFDLDTTLSQLANIAYNLKSLHQSAEKLGITVQEAPKFMEFYGLLQSNIEELAQFMQKDKK